MTQTQSHNFFDDIFGDEEGQTSTKFESKADPSLLLGLKLPSPPKKENQGQKVHPFVKLANEKKTKAGKAVEEILDLRTRCSTYIEIAKEEEKLSLERRRRGNKYPDNSSRRNNPPKPRTFKQRMGKDSEDDQPNRGPPYRPNVLKYDDIFSTPTEQANDKKDRMHAGSRSRSKHAMKVMKQIQQERHQRENLTRKEQEGDSMRMEVEENVTSRPIPTQTARECSAKSEQKDLGYSESDKSLITPPYNTKHKINQQEKSPKTSPQADLLSQGSKTSKRSDQPSKPNPSSSKKDHSHSKPNPNEESLKKRKNDLSEKERQLHQREAALKRELKQIQQEKQRRQHEEQRLTQRRYLDKIRQDLDRRDMLLKQKQAQINKKQVQERSSSKKEIHRPSKRQHLHQSKRKHRSPSHSPSYKSTNSSANDQDWKKQLRQITRYNPQDQKYLNRDKKQIKESNFLRLNKEDEMSRKYGQYQEEQEIIREKRLKRKHY